MHTIYAYEMHMHIITIPYVYMYAHLHENCTYVHIIPYVAHRDSRRQPVMFFLFPKDRRIWARKKKKIFDPLACSTTSLVLCLSLLLWIVITNISH